MLVAVTFGFLGTTPVRPLVPSRQVAAAAGTTEAEEPALPPSIVPEIIAGVRAMNAGTLPSREALSAIGHVLEIAKTDPGARDELQRLLARVDGGQGDAAGWFDSEHDPRLANDPFLPLEWGYQEAVARTSARDKLGIPEDAAAGAGQPQGQRVREDARGQAAGFASLLFGKQQAAGDEDGTRPAQGSSRAAIIAAALRREVVHARSDIAAAEIDADAARRATPPGSQADAAVITVQGVTYRRESAGQPPAVPDARRLLLRNFFNRSAPE